tara:strand:- start:6943 stop:7686 length:744 start_codon:yes stop_codon:yes gene_type:complete
MKNQNVMFGNLEGTDLVKFNRQYSELTSAVANKVFKGKTESIDLGGFIPSTKPKNFNLLEIVGNISKGKLSDFNKIDKQYRRDLLGIAKNRLSEHNKSYAKDIAQNVLGKLFFEISEGKITEENTESYVESILFGSISYEVLNIQHSGNKNSFEYKTRPINDENNEIETFESCITELNAFDEILNGENKNELRQAVNRLPKKFRHILKLRFYFQMNNKEVSEVLKLEHTLVRNRFVHAIKNLKRELS